MSLIIPWEHVEDIQKLTAEDWIWIGRLFSYAVDKLGLPGGGLASRFGDAHYHSGTIQHLHFNVIVPVPESGQDCFVPLSDNHEVRFESRLSLFLHGEELKRRGGPDWLFSKESIASTRV
ncbi:hypothetical protein HYV30_03700 [Candidatus Kaiserbacteria bacterium]|nr:hypothetical protein [Candidatus Kaiserbacteria bacterium]